MNTNMVRYSTPKDIDKEYERTGECNKCGECCKYYITFEDVKEKRRYFEGLGFFRKKINDKAVMILQSKCKYLDDKNQCKLHGSRKKPICCIQFPMPEDYVYLFVKKKCGYKFKPKEKQIKMSG